MRFIFAVGVAAGLVLPTISWAQSVESPKTHVGTVLETGDARASKTHVGAVLETLIGPEATKVHVGVVLETLALPGGSGRIFGIFGAK